MINSLNMTSQLAEIFECVCHLIISEIYQQSDTCKLLITS